MRRCSGGGAVEVGHRLRWDGGCGDGGGMVGVGTAEVGMAEAERQRRPSKAEPRRQTGRGRAAAELGWR